MNVSIVGRNVDLSETIKEQVNSAIETFTKFNLDIIGVHAIISGQDKHRNLNIEFTLNIAGNNTVVIRQKDDDLYAAIDRAATRVQNALRRIHEKATDHKNESINNAKKSAAGSVDMKAISEAQEEEIIPYELDTYKPKEPVEVLDSLKDGSHSFEVFLDNTGKTRVMFKRNDGKFGLY